MMITATHQDWIDGFATVHMIGQGETSWEAAAHYFTPFTFRMGLQGARDRIGTAAKMLNAHAALATEIHTAYSRMGY